MVRAPDRAALRCAARSFRLALLLSLGCSPTATIGTYTDGGVRCDPLADDCGDGMTCSLRSDPAMDACRASGGLPVGATCADLDACEPGAQCVVLGPTGATLDPAGGTCARVCARDAPSCARCVGLLAESGVRIDYGVCAP